MLKGFFKRTGIIFKSVEIVCILALMFSTFMVVASPVNDENVKQIVFDWFCEQLNHSDLEIDKFSLSLCGSFDDGNVSVYNTDYEFGYATVITYKRVGNRILVFPYTDQLMAVYDGQNVYDLETAYELGLLNDERLDAIAEPAKYLWTYVLGDLDCDGNVSVTDLVYLRKRIMGVTASPIDISPDFIFYDIDADGKLSVSDIVNLRSIVMNEVSNNDKNDKIAEFKRKFSAGEYEPDKLIVGLTKESSGINKPIDDVFYTISDNILSVEDLTKVPNYGKEPTAIDEDNFCQIFLITLKEGGAENLLDAMIKLDSLPMVESINLNYIVIMD